MLFLILIYVQFEVFFGFLQNVFGRLKIIGMNPTPVWKFLLQCKSILKDLMDGVAAFLRGGVKKKQMRHLLNKKKYLYLTFFSIFSTQLYNFSTAHLCVATASGGLHRGKRHNHLSLFHPLFGVYLNRNVQFKPSPLFSL